MTFLNPWALTFGLLAIGTPFVIHFLTKPRPKAKPLSTIRFVFESIQQRRSRHRLRDFLVLLLRVLAIAMIAFAIARPQWRESVIAAPNSEVDIARVVILDVSQSMEAGRGGNQPIERARAVADRYLRQQNGLVVGLVLTAANSEPVFDQFSANFAVLRQTVRNVQPKPQAANAMSAINIAADLLSKTDERMKRELVVVSDFQRSDWGAIRLDALPRDTAVQMESVALQQSNNLGVLDIRTSNRVVAGEPFTCEVEVGNFSELEQPTKCSIRIGTIKRTVEQVVPPGQSTIMFQLELPDSGWLSGTAQLISAGDDLPSDDTRPWVLKVADKPKVILLSAQSVNERPSSGYYLDRAIGFLVGRTGDKGLARVHPFTGDTNAIDDADVLVVDRPGRLPANVIKKIAGSLRRGQGILYVVSELVDGVNISAIGKELGASMQLPVRFVPPAGRRARRNLSVYEVSRRESPFDIFGDTLDSAFGTVRIGGGLGTEQTDQALKDRVLAKLSDQSALLVISDAGDGKIAILNADLEQSNLPVKPPFVPMVGELITQLLPDADGETESDCGKPLVRLMPPAVALEDRLTVSPADDWPENAEGYGTWEASSSGVLWQWPAPNECGVYQVNRGQETMMSVAVTTPASESDLATLDADVIENTGDGTRPLGFRDARDTPEDDDRWWNWLLVACLCGLFCEVAVLRIFRT